jgi:hypothetical protein
LLNILYGVPDSSHPEVTKYSKQWENNNLSHLSTDEPTYWTSDWNKLPDLVNFCVTKGITQNFAIVKSCFDLSDHFLIIITLTTQVQNQEKQPYLSNKYTKWKAFRHFINKKLSLKVPFKTEEDIEAAVKYFNNTIQLAGWNTTPEHTDHYPQLPYP